MENFAKTIQMACLNVMEENKAFVKFGLYFTAYGAALFGLLIAIGSWLLFKNSGYAESIWLAYVISGIIWLFVGIKITVWMKKTPYLN